MSKTSKTTQENKPPQWAQGLFEQSADVTDNLFNSGSGGNTFMGSGVADLSGTTMQGVNQLAGAGQNWNTAGTRPLFQGIGAASVGPSYSEQNLGTIASGGDNPYFQEALQNQLGDTADLISSRMSGAGRMNSGAHTGVMTTDLGKISTQALSDQWNQNIQNMFGANQLMDGNRNAGLDRALSATSSMAGQDQQQFQNQLTGAGATLQAGGILDQQAQRQLSDEIAKWYAKDNEGWTRLGMLQGAAAGAAGPYGTQLATSRQPMNIGGIMSGFGGLMGK